MECSENDLQIVHHGEGVSFGCPTCRQVFAKGNFTIEMGCCGKSQVICNPDLIECCKAILPVPRTFDTQAEVDEFVTAVRLGKIPNIDLASHEFLTKL